MAWYDTPAPAYYADASFPYTTDAAIGRTGIFYSDGTPGPPTIILSQAGATGYYVLNYYGVQVSTGSLSGSTTTCTPVAPEGGWPCGWYRCYFTGPDTDENFGPSYGVTNFVVVRNTSYMVPNPTSTVSTVENLDPAMRGVMGCGPSRLEIYDAGNLSDSPGGESLTNAETLAAVMTTYYANLNAPYYDPNRPRPLWVEFINGGVDTLQLPGSGGGTGGAGGYLQVYAKTGTLAAGGDVYASVGAGSVSGNKVTVYYPDATTVVETYDNLASASAASTAINAASNYIVAYPPGTGGVSTAGTLAVTAIGNAKWTGVGTVVSTLYPLGITRFEGPTNEPTLSLNTVQQMKLFQAAVHAGNADALAIGPCPENITTLTGTNSWTTFLAGGGAAYCDELSFHDYDTIVNGDINEGRTQIAAFLALLAEYDVDLPMWQTEATNVFYSVYGVYHPRRSRVPLLMTLLWEQYGIPHERNPVWYDYSQGYWAYPSWLKNADGSLNPVAGLFRTLTEETFGQPYSSALTFPGPAENMMVGNVYSTPGGGTSTVAIQCASYMPGATVTLNISGAKGSLVVVDGFGNESTVTISTGGQATISVSEIPTYVQLSAGATVTVATVNGWQPTNVNQALTASATIGGVATTVINDGQFMTSYPGGTSVPGVAFSTGSIPGDTAELSWASPVKVDRLIIFCGGVCPWQALSALSNFEVQTSVDGSTWVTQQTVTKTGVSSFWFGSDESNAACTYETYWDEQGIFDVPFPNGAVLCNAVRIVVTATSYGGEPDANAISAGGQGAPSQRLVLQEMMATLGSTTVHVLPPGSGTLVHT
jgi:hypothetical protein